MKAKLLMLLLAVLFISPMSEAATTTNEGKIHYKKSVRIKRICTRIPIDYTIETVNDESCLQIIFQFPLPDADITVTDKNGNTVIEEQQTRIHEGKAVYIYTPEAYPYMLEITSPTVDITGEIVLEEE